MSNPFDGLITNELITQFNQAISEVLRASKTSCRIYLPVTRWQACSACAANIGNSNPFLRGKQTTSCEVCGGTNKVPIITTEDIELIVIYSQKKFEAFGNNVGFAERAEVQTFADVSLIKKVKRAQYVVFDTENEPQQQNKYVRDGDAELIGFSDKQFFLQRWKNLT